MSDERLLTVSQVTARLKGVLEGSFTDLWVIGEIVGLKRHTSGHLYFSLKDSGARLAAACFRNQLRFLAVRPEELRDGVQVRCRGRISLYEPQGSYSLVVEQMQLEGRGALLEALEQLKNKLAAEGLFDEARKQPLPYLPRCIGVVTSESGAAIQDMLRIIGERFPCHVKLRPAAVQGEAAAADIAAGLRQLDRDPEVEVIIVGRGGGAFEDLLPFSDEAVVRAVARCATPVVSAVGHEVDFPLCDLAADRRAPTPTAAAQMVVPDRAALLAWVAEQERQLGRQAERLLADRELGVGDLFDQLEGAMESALVNRERVLERVGSRLAVAHPAVRLERLGERLKSLRQTLHLAIDHRLELHGARLERLAGELSSLGPESQLARGYALVRRVADGVPVTRHDQVGIGEGLEVLLHAGRLEAVVTGVREGGVGSRGRAVPGHLTKGADERRGG